MEMIKVGVVGAGANTRLHHIPKLQNQKGVEIEVVCNRSLASSQKVAAEFDIPHVASDWMELVEDINLDAIVIGTWPYLHAPISIAALKANKHVLCEARMAMNLREAQEMMAVSRYRPDLVAQLVPAPMSLGVDKTIQNILTSDQLGDLLNVDLSFGGVFLDLEAPMSWRQDRSLSGDNIMSLGILYEMLMRWIGPVDHVMARCRTFGRRRLDGNQILRSVEVPDHVDILAESHHGAAVRIQVSAVCGGAPLGNSVHFYGSEGTLCYHIDNSDLTFMSNTHPNWKQIDIPKSDIGEWRVEEEFVAAIRGQGQVQLTRFEDGLKYMAFTDAVHRSARSGQRVHIER
jgi:predicted dehydrogenase